MLQVEDVRTGEQKYPADGQHRLLHPVIHRQRRPHQQQADRSQRERAEPAVAQHAEPDRGRADRDGQRQPHTVDRRIEHPLAADAEHGDQHQAGQAMHQAQPRQGDADAVEPVANRKQCGAHACPL
jgi:hypothetical protein